MVIVHSYVSHYQRVVEQDPAIFFEGRGWISDMISCSPNMLISRTRNSAKLIRSSQIGQVGKNSDIDVEFGVVAEVDFVVRISSSQKTYHNTLDPYDS